jgi:hypothetical protein
MHLECVILVEKFDKAILIKQSDFGEWLYLKTEKPNTRLITGALYDIEFEICSKKWKERFITRATLTSITFSDDNL